MDEKSFKKLKSYLKSSYVWKKQTLTANFHFVRELSKDEKVKVGVV